MAVAAEDEVLNRVWRTIEGAQGGTGLLKKPPPGTKPPTSTFAAPARRFNWPCSLHACFDDREVPFEDDGPGGAKSFDSVLYEQAACPKGRTESKVVGG